MENLLPRLLPWWAPLLRPAPIDFECFASLADAEPLLRRLGPLNDAHRSSLRRLRDQAVPARMPGHCVACGRESQFQVARPGGPDGEPNWREDLVCVRCGLKQRDRAMLDALRRFGPPPSARRQVYVTEQVTPFARWLERQPRRFGAVQGSEYRGAAQRPGRRFGPWRSLRHEDLTGLSFRGRRFDVVISQDVLEHIPDYRQALAECARVLAPGGVLLLSVPFRMLHQETLVRAEVGDAGEVVHHEPPEYHGDPMRAGRGVLCYYHFGWDLLDAMRAAGFASAAAAVWWDPRRGYLGLGQVVLLGYAAAVRPA